MKKRIIIAVITAILALLLVFGGFMLYWHIKTEEPYLLSEQSDEAFKEFIMSVDSKWKEPAIGDEIDEIELELLRDAVEFTEENYESYESIVSRFWGFLSSNENDSDPMTLFKRAVYVNACDYYGWEVNPLLRSEE